MRERILTNILITGGAGFIGSNFIRYLFNQAGFNGRVINLDKLTYAGNLQNLTDLDERFGGSRYFFHRGDVSDQEAVKNIFDKYDIDTVVHFAAESHVDRSIYGPADFIRTNIIGTFTLLEVARQLWKSTEGKLFHHVSTDEVYGSIDEGQFNEESPYNPSSPYAASKAASDHLVRSYFRTYGLPATISNCSNNYGPYQFPEKLIPLMILNMLDGKPLPVYGDGKNVRDWIYVDDHSRALWMIVKNGSAGKTYNVGAGNEWRNIDLVNLLCERVAHSKQKTSDYYKKSITFIKDRPGHDLRYALSIWRIQQDLGWLPGIDFEQGLDNTIIWYCENARWIESVKTGDYKNWIDANYSSL